MVVMVEVAMGDTGEEAMGVMGGGAGEVGEGVGVAMVDMVITEEVEDTDTDMEATAATGGIMEVRWFFLFM